MQVITFLGNYYFSHEIGNLKYSFVYKLVVPFNEETGILLVLISIKIT